MSTVWKECLKKLKSIVPIEEYTQNLQHIKAKQNRNTLTLLAKNTNSLSWINTNIYYTINSIITKNHSHIQLKITVDNQKDNRPNMTNLIR